MQEIEVKILEVDAAKIIAKLESLGAKKVLEGEDETSLFDFVDLRLHAEGKLLRVRKQGGITTLTFKQKISREGVKVMEEYETEVSDCEEMKKILQKIGLIELPKPSKHRISYVLGDVRFEIDTFREIPTYLEIEAPSVEEVQTWVQKLGFSKDDAKPWSAEEVFEYYGKE
jgi:adenylate cyclase class 2